MSRRAFRYRALASLRARAAQWLARAVAIVVLTGSAARAAEGPDRVDFEGPQVSWRTEQADVAYRIERHQRAFDLAHSGRGSELVQFSAEESGTFVNMVHVVGPAPAIAELTASVWVRADRPGVQLGARVVLPRATDPRTGRPLVTLVAGDSYRHAGSWERLSVSNLPQEVLPGVRALRAELGRDVDLREAYIDGVVLNIYTGGGKSRVWIDDLELDGYISLAGRTPRELPSDRTERSAVPEKLPGRMAGSAIVADGRPLMPRIVEYRGEPLARLKQLGFNAVWLDVVPNELLLSEAERAGLWLVCPPPLVLDESDPTQPLPDPAPIDPTFRRVLAWHVGRGLTRNDLEPARRLIEQLRRADAAASRPIVAGAMTDLGAYSRVADIVLLERFPEGTSFELADYRTWLHERPGLARPGTPIWTSIQTETPPAVMAQWRSLLRSMPRSLGVGSEQARLAVYTALSAGARGILYASSTPLDEATPATRWRAASLELLNIELDLAELWLAGGRYISTVEANTPDVVAAMLQTQRAHLLLPVWTGQNAQYAPGQSVGHETTFVVPGDHSAAECYELSPVGLRRLQHKRVTGGTLVTLDDFGLATMILLTRQDQAVIADVQKRVGRHDQRAAQLARDLAAMKLETVRSVQPVVAARQQSGPVDRADPQSWITSAQASLDAANRRIAASDFRQTYRDAEDSLRASRNFERHNWSAAVARLGSPVSNPLAVSPATAALLDSSILGRVAAAGAGNRVAEGGFESLALIEQAGWIHREHSQPGLRSMAELSPTYMVDGKFSLRLAVMAETPEMPPVLVETPPVWITSPAVPVSAGQIVRIGVWVNIPKPVTASVDGLMIIDSLAGEVLAERIDETKGWQQVTLFRAAPADGAVRVSVALTGLGEAWIDSMSIEPLGPVTAQAPQGLAPLTGVRPSGAPNFTLLRTPPK